MSNRIAMTAKDEESDLNSVVLNDDCLRIVFGYLTIRDKFRLERVSKQFQKLIHHKGWYFKVNNNVVPKITNQYNLVDIQLFKSLCQKYWNIRRIDCSAVLVNDPVLDVITNCCSRLKAINFCVNDLTEEAITRFGDQLGHRLKFIFFLREDESSHENQQILIKRCPNLEIVYCQYFDSVNDIDSGHLKKLYLLHYQMWSNSEVQAFGQFVDRYQDKELSHLSIYSETDVYDFLDDILIHVQRLSNLKLFDFYESSNGEEPLQRPVPKFKNLSLFCKKLKKVILDFTLDNFDLWRTFRDFDALEELEIERFSIENIGPVLVDSNSLIRPLVKLKKFKIRCQSIGFYFFFNVTEFSPYIEILKIDVIEPQHQLTNHSLTALSQCKKLKELDLDFHNTLDPDLNDIGFIHLLDNCKDINRIVFKFQADFIIISLAKWMQLEDSIDRRRIIFEFKQSDFIIHNGLSDLYLLDNVRRLSLIGKLENLLVIQLNKDLTLSVDLFISYLWNNRSDIWQIFSRHKDLKQLVFRNSYFDFYKSVPNIEPLINLSQISIACLRIDNAFFANIAKIAPNLKDFELDSPFLLTNCRLKVLYKLKQLTRLNLMSSDKKYHSADDNGIIHLFENCAKLREVLFDFEIDISSHFFDKLKVLANERPKEIIRFKCLVNSPELQSNLLTGIPNNLIIQTKFIEEKE